MNAIALVPGLWLSALGAQPVPASGPAEVPPVVIGQEAPELTLKKLLQAPQGASTTLAGLRGRAVVLEFWGTWCAPCVAAFPHINGLVEAMKGEPIVFIAITEESEEKVAPFLKERELSAWVGLDRASTTTRAYHVKAYPTTVLIDRAGVVRARTHPLAVDAPMLGRLIRGEPMGPSPEAADAQVQPPAAAGATALPAGTIDLNTAHYLVWVGPPTPGIGNPASGDRHMRTPRTSLASVLPHCYGLSGHRVFFEGIDGGTELGYEVRLPPAHPRTAKEVLREALESAMGLRTRREQRELDVVVLRRLGDRDGPKAGDDGPGQAMWLDTFIEAENTGLDMLTTWVEQRLGKPVIDETGLRGTYTYSVRIKEQTAPAIRAAIEPLGLAIAEEKRALEIIVVTPANAFPGR